MTAVMVYTRWNRTGSVFGENGEPGWTVCRGRRTADIWCSWLNPGWFAVKSLREDGAPVRYVMDMDEALHLAVALVTS